MNVTTTRNGDRLYTGRSLAFLAREYYVNAWGRYNVSGVLFDLDTGARQSGALAFCNLPASESEIVAQALAAAES